MTNTHLTNLTHLNEHQVATGHFANRALTAVDSLTTLALGVAGEAGEVADLVKKHIGHGHPLDREKLSKELGDVLWYVARMAATIGYDLAFIANQNIDKLTARYPDGFTTAASLNRKPE